MADAIANLAGPAASELTGTLTQNPDGSLTLNLTGGLTVQLEGSLAVSGIFNPGLSLPLGAGCHWFTGTAPTNFLFPYGQAISRTTYADLFALWSTQFGVGDGSTTFNMPDLRGCGFAGLDNMGGTAADRLQKSTASVLTTNGSPTLSGAGAPPVAVGMFIFSSNVPAGTTVLSISSGSNDITMSANATASGFTDIRFSLINDPQTVGGVGGNQIHTLIEAQMPAHTHDTGAVATNTTSGGAANRLTGTANTYTGGSAGGGQPHPNVQPTFMGYYIIRVL